MTPINRINLKGDLNSLVDRICEVFSIGELVSFNVIETGYEDCNIKIVTTKGKFLAKIFSKQRTKDEIDRYSDIMISVLESGVNHPRLLKTKQNEHIYVDGVRTRRGFFRVGSDPYKKRTSKYHHSSSNN